MYLTVYKDAPMLGQTQGRKNKINRFKLQMSGEGFSLDIQSHLHYQVIFKVSRKPDQSDKIKGKFFPNL